MSRESKIAEINELSKQIKRPIEIKRYIRQRIVQEETIDAYRSPVPSSVVVNGKQKMVEKDDWVVIKSDGSIESYKPAEFNKIFEEVKPETTQTNLQENNYDKSKYGKR